ncbi:hypothetical protein W97_08411 [Coniosporium apollinis CBS 100218]|uniref:Uncharacterized protein n=1 Tax=Coniosporium apollinis (strain CBS 100218) TaxID=1168221 RepID=R7Z4U1_CONA1|nr:uncharacterized protein W97_08411 [Coniosporium apollinis CBS 100218]EON69098.1 hypothetical protein W97_08411 [Coniosporium apollinis CBS 100218]
MGRLAADRSLYRPSSHHNRCAEETDDGLLEPGVPSVDERPIRALASRALAAPETEDRLLEPGVPPEAEPLMLWDGLSPHQMRRRADDGFLEHKVRSAEPSIDSVELPDPGGSSGTGSLILGDELSPRQMRGRDKRQDPRTRCPI